ncbi:MAG TPA: class IV adenylate cyclase [Terriglobales bacterium]|nr:class IV adenylate cyclase [Terriglobales bacterium]
MPSEVEVKFHVDDLNALRERLQKIGFQEITPRTHEFNTLYDSNGRLRRRGELLRIRKYGDRWVLTHKAKSHDARHKTRLETETRIEDGEALGRIFESLGFDPQFSYEKFRSEWTDGQGHVVLDETPIGDFGEIEGSPGWIDAIAQKIGVDEANYITKSYADLFFDWTNKHNSWAKNMTFAEVKSK